jgi:hypothetical protein
MNFRYDMNFQHREILRTSIITGLLVILLSCVCSAETIIADHTAVWNFESIPQTVVDQIGSTFSIYYGHRSHGSQIITGLDMIESDNPAYAKPSFFTIIASIDDENMAWETNMRHRLDMGLYNIATMAWCEGCSEFTESEMNEYFVKFEQLEQDYPNVTFIYMTGHMDGTGIGGNVYARNNQIRNYCIANGKILYDFADIESYDPEGNYFPNETEACGWCYDWCSTAECLLCGTCEHSHCFNCHIKAKAFWWLLARIAGWVPEGVSCGDVNEDGLLDVLDIVLLIDFKFKDGPPPNQMERGDVNSDTFLDILDIIHLIDFKFKSGDDPFCEYLP